MRREHLGLSQAAFGRYFGVSGSYVSSWEQAGTVPGQRVIMEGARELGDGPAEWLAAAGLETEPPESPAPLSRVPPVEGGAACVWLPIAGTLRGAVVVNAEEDPGESFPCLPDAVRQAEYVVRIEGSSMWPELKPGDVAAIRKAGVARPGQVVVARRGDETMVKRYGGKVGRQIRLCSENPEYDEIVSDDIEIIGVLVWTYREYA